MAHFAEIDSNNTVLRVIVVHDSECLDANGVETEEAGAAFCNRHFGGTWVKTSYNGNTRRRFAGIGCTFDAERDAFIPRKPFASWVFDEVDLNWVAPVQKPDDGKYYLWDEETVSWKEAVQSEPVPLPLTDEIPLHRILVDPSTYEVYPTVTEQVVAPILHSGQIEILTTAQIAPLSANN